MKHKTALGVLLYLAVTVVLFFITHNSANQVDATPTPSSPPALTVPPPVAEMEPVVPEDTPRESVAPPSEKILSVTMKSGDTVASILNRLGVAPQEMAPITQCLRQAIDLRRLSPGDELRVYQDPNDDSLNRVEFEKQNECVVTLTPHDDDWKSEKRPITFTTYRVKVMGEIQTCFYDAAVAAGLTPQTVLDFAEIFAWDIDFLTDLQVGDRFSLVYEKLYNEGKFVRDGRILAARFNAGGTVHEAFYFEREKELGAYYQRDGKSMRKQFVKSPLQYTRISSYFTRARLHPILKIVRPHLGVDYAAPEGTPVSTIGDGKIVFCGRKGGYGNFLQIRHSGGYVTAYGHLKSFASGIHMGSVVKQGEMIARVGKTGLATGPHLDFRVMKDGEFINPLSLKSVPSDPVPKKGLAQFRKLVTPLVATLDALDRTQMFASESGRVKATH